MAAMTHAICDECWYKRNPNRKPVKLIDRYKETCCYCLKETYSGIYIRDDISNTKCEGKHEP